MRNAMLAALFAATVAGSAYADRLPPGSMPLSQILVKFEQQPEFAYFEEIELDDGYYEIEYRTKGGEKREIKVDPRTGEPRSR